MIDTALLVIVTAAAIVVTGLCLYSNEARIRTRSRARARVRLHQMRRARELSEIRVALRSDARRLRRALDSDFDAVDEL